MSTPISVKNTHTHTHTQKKDKNKSKNNVVRDVYFYINPTPGTIYRDIEKGSIFLFFF